MKFSTYLILFLFISFISCKTQQSSSGSGGGPTPTAADLNDYIDRMTTPEDKICEDLRVDYQQPKKYPIIYPSGEYQWKNDYSNTLSDQFDKDYMRPLKKQKINEGDLSLIGCKGYNYATDEEKKQFWILFTSSMSKAESNFKPDEEFREEDGSVSTGLLQIDPKSSNRWCGILSKEKNKKSFDSSDMHNPSTNLQCGLLMMQGQVMGVPMGRPMKQTRPEFEGRLFTGDNFWYWSVLSDRNSRAKKRVIDWFRVHAQRQLAFCNRANPIDGHVSHLHSEYKEMNCTEIQDTTEKENCEKYLLNEKEDLTTFNPKLGENPVDKKCHRIENGARTNAKDLLPKDKTTDKEDSEAVSK